MMMLVLAALLSAPAGAQDAGAEVATTVAVEPEKPVCRRVERTGSLVGGRRICMSRDEWDRAGQATRKELTNAIDRIPARGVR